MYHHLSRADGIPQSRECHVSFSLGESRILLKMGGSLVWAYGRLGPIFRLNAQLQLGPCSTVQLMREERDLR